MAGSTTTTWRQVEYTDHAHGGYLTSLSHSHSGYAASSHSHSAYAASSHSHSTYLTSLPSHSHSTYLTSLPSHSHSGYISSLDHSHTAFEVQSMTADTLKSTAGTYFFKASNLLGQNYDWAGLQVDAGNDKFQICGSGGTLMVRQNDSGGTNSTSWTSWVDLATTTHAHSEYLTSLSHSHSGYAASSHSHSYATTSHSHSYATTSHSHSTYAASSHSHSTYLTSLTHDHSEYAHTHSLAHTHTGYLTSLSHSHSAYAKTSHSHSAYITSLAHSHSEYAASSHSHSEYSSGGGSLTISTITSNKAYICGYTYTSGSNVTTLYAHGSVYMSGGYLYTSSDARLKYNLKPISTEFVDKIYNYDKDLVYDFTWKETDENATGFIAQYLEEFDSNLVNTDNDSGLKAVNYDAALAKLVGVLLKKTKEQDRIIKEHDNKINELEKHVNELENVVRKLLSM